MDSQKNDEDQQNSPGVMDVKPPTPAEESQIDAGTTVAISPDGEPTFITPTPGSSIQPQAPQESIDEPKLEEASVVVTEQQTIESTEPTQDQITEPPQTSQQPDVVTEPSQVEPAQEIESKPDLPKDVHQEVANEQQPNPMAIPPKPKKSGSPKAVIFVAILVALALAGASVFAYLKMQETTNTSTSPAQTEQQVEKEPEITADDVDAAVKEVDEQINTTDDTKDIPSAESINDQTLGL